MQTPTQEKPRSFFFILHMSQLKKVWVKKHFFLNKMPSNSTRALCVFLVAAPSQPTIAFSRAIDSVKRLVHARACRWGDAQRLATSPKLWGPVVWDAMFAVARKYDAGNKQLFVDFFKALGLLLPCQKCRRHYRLMLRTIPVAQLKTAQEYEDMVAHMRATVRDRVAQKKIERGIK
jgi:hypothetical protein